MRTNSGQSFLEQDLMQLTEKSETRQTSRSHVIQSIQVQIQNFQVSQEFQLTSRCAVEVVVRKVGERLYGGWNLATAAPLLLRSNPNKLQGSMLMMGFISHFSLLN